MNPATKPIKHPLNLDATSEAISRLTDDQLESLAGVVFPVTDSRVRSEQIMLRNAQTPSAVRRELQQLVCLLRLEGEEQHMTKARVLEQTGILVRHVGPLAKRRAQPTMDI